MLDEKEQELRALNMQWITYVEPMPSAYTRERTIVFRLSRTKDELLQLQHKVQNQDSNAETIRNAMQIELDKLRHWLQIYENRKDILRPQYHETLKELEIKLHEQEVFYRKQIKDLDYEMRRKSFGRSSDDSG